MTDREPARDPLDEDGADPLVDEHAIDEGEVEPTEEAETGPDVGDVYRSGS
ncbi:MAG: hypothetical protein KY392_04815 [Chloroflexi bacterium]|nr:hypothetical protein [Chloroflexota bacterium]